MDDKVYVSLMLLFSYTNKVATFNFFVPIINTNEISLRTIMSVVATKIEIKDDTVVSYFDCELNSFIYCGIYPALTKDTLISVNKNEKFISIQLKLRKIVHKEGMLRAELLEDENENVDEKRSKNYINANSKRAKERKIGDIIKKVYMWRKLYFGYKDKEGNEIKFSLEEAAVKIGISKKSLDDYLIQLRIGKMYGFNFNEHKNDKVGILRAFVKKNKPNVNNKYDAYDLDDFNY